LLSHAANFGVITTVRLMRANSRVGFGELGSGLCLGDCRDRKLAHPLSRRPTDGRLFVTVTLFFQIAQPAVPQKISAKHVDNLHD
jgi:hypothetical protein